MDGILEKYNSSRFEECLNLLEKEAEKDDDLVENLIKQNCIEVCKSLRLISQNDSSKAVDTLRNLYKSYQNTVAPGLPGDIIPLQLELTSLFNFVWWGLFHGNLETSEGTDRKGYLKSIQRGLRRGVSCKKNNYVSTAKDILHDIRNAGKKLQIIDYSIVCLLAEIIVLILLYVLVEDSSADIVVQCLETVTTIIFDMEKLIIGLEAVREFDDPFPLYDRLFKFGFNKINSTASYVGTNAINYLYIIKSLCFFLLKKYENVLLVMKNNLKQGMEPMWCYLGSLSTLMLCDYNQCLGFVVMSEGLRFDGPLKSRFNILHGLLLSRKEDYKEAIKCFMEAKRICPGSAAACYYMGEEYGKIGLSDDMVDCFKEAIKVKQKQKFKKVKSFTNTFESVILDLLHPADEITESEATYAAAVACGLIERYQESTDMFEKYIEIRNVEEEQNAIQERIIKTPSITTILHEAATMNILTGNFSRAEYLLSQAVDRYIKLEDPIAAPKKDVHVAKDANWLRTLIHDELGLSKPVSNERNNSIDLFSEEMVYFFEEDVIALMLSAEMESRVDDGMCKAKLGKLISLFMKYCAQMQRNEIVREQEKACWTLVKALSGRICLNAANYQLKGKTSGAEIERMFKRALSCNQGDKDILYGYCKFLLGDGKASDAQKLWRTFRGKEPALVVDQCQSLALRYLLRSQVTEREWEKLETDLNLSEMDVDFDV